MTQIRPQPKAHRQRLARGFGATDVVDARDEEANALVLEENLAAHALKLTREDGRQIDEGASRITIAGARYPEVLEARTGL